MNSVCKVAILIDGGYFTKRFKSINRREVNIADIQPFLDDVMNKVQAISPQSVTDILFRSFYYDCRPFAEVKNRPDGRRIDFSQNQKFKTGTSFQRDLKTFPQMALRLGTLSFDGWKIDPKDPSKLIPDFKQKAVDMKIGLDIAWMSSKRTIDKLVLVAGDSDFVAPMKFARKEGIWVYLCALGQANIKMELKEHADFILQ
jgi:uncharacterized LabA/DUF88 family protein